MYHSQDKQDFVLDTRVFAGVRNGVFVDVGAWDGVCFSNTLFFERERGWTGIQVEPIRERYDALVRNRPNCINLNVAVTDVEGETDFLSITGDTGMLSGIYSNYDARHLERIANETQTYNNTATLVKVPTRRLDSIFREHNITRVHYLSIDVEGAELGVLRSIDFSKVFIDVIGFETNYPDKAGPMLELLEQNGYERLPIRGYDTFMIHKRSAFRSRYPSFIR